MRGLARLGARRQRSCSGLCGAPCGLGTQARLRTRAESAIPSTGPAGQRPEAEPGGGGEGRPADREPGPLGCRCKGGPGQAASRGTEPARSGESSGRGRGGDRALASGVQEPGVVWPPEGRGDSGVEGVERRGRGLGPCGLL